MRIERLVLGILIKHLRRGNITPPQSDKRIYLNVFNTGILLDIERMKPKAKEALCLLLERLKRYI
jgi:hypothetical protein